MVSLLAFKPRFLPFLRPIAAQLVERKVTANLVTIAALAIAVVIGFLLALTEGNRIVMLVMPVAIAAHMALQAIDGIMATEHGQGTEAGALLNELSNFAAEAVMFLPLAYAAAVSPPLLVMLVMVGLLAEVTGLLGPTFRAARRMDGPFGRTDRAVFFALLALLLALGAGGSWVSWVLILAIGLGGWTVWIRARKVLREGA